MPPADAPGFCKEICRYQRPKSGAVNAKTKSILAFTITNNCSSFLPFSPASQGRNRLHRKKQDRGWSLSCLQFTGIVP